MRHVIIKRILALLIIHGLLLTVLPGCRQENAKVAAQADLTAPAAIAQPKDTELFPAGQPLPHEAESAEAEQPATETPAPEDAASNTDTPAQPPAVSAMTQLQQTVQSKVNSYGGVWSVYVKRLDTGESFVINDGPMVAASLIKLYVYGAIGQAELSGQITPGAYDGVLSPMITVSDNYSCNVLIDVLGMSAINQFIQNQGYWNTSLNRKMLSGEPVENYTSVSECGRLLEQVYCGTYVSADTSASLLADLQNQTRRWKIPSGLPGGVMSANKTGELADVENDVAIVYGPTCTYILCVMSDGVAPGIAQSNIIDISSTVYYALNG